MFPQSRNHHHNTDNRQRKRLKLIAEKRHFSFLEPREFSRAGTKKLKEIKPTSGIGVGELLNFLIEKV